MERNENPISKAIKAKLQLVNKEVEEAWSSDLNALYSEIDLTLLSTGSRLEPLRTQIESFGTITTRLIKHKAKSMMTTTLEVLSNVAADENLQVEVKNFILTFFDESAYSERLTRFVRAVDRKFRSYGILPFGPEELRLNQIESLFQVGIKNALRDARAEINADFALFRGSIRAKHPELTEEANKSTSNVLSEQYVFKKTGSGGWIMVFNGDPTGPLKHIGLAYFHYCIKNYPKEFTNIELEQAVKEKTHIPVDHEHLPIDPDYDKEFHKELDGFQVGSSGQITSRQELADFQTINKTNDYRKKLKIEIAEAERDNDPFVQIEELKMKLEKTEAYLAECARKGKLKVFKDERTKVSARVSKAMARALEDLRSQNEEAYHHLDEAFKPIYSSSKKYRPLTPVHWILE